MTIATIYGLENFEQLFNMGYVIPAKGKSVAIKMLVVLYYDHISQSFLVHSKWHFNYLTECSKVEFLINMDIDMFNGTVTRSWFNSVLTYIIFTI